MKFDISEANIPETPSWRVKLKEKNTLVAKQLCSSTITEIEGAFYQQYDSLTDSLATFFNVTYYDAKELIEYLKNIKSIKNEKIHTT